MARGILKTLNLRCSVFFYLNSECLSKTEIKGKYTFSVLSTKSTWRLLTMVTGS